MTDTTTTEIVTEPTETESPDDAETTTTESPEPDTTADSEPTKADEPPADDATKKARREAAGYRERLRATEAERDTAKELVSNLRRQIIDGHSDQLGLKPAALWAAGFTIDDLTTEDGLIDAEKIAAAVNDARDILGIQRFHGGADGGKRGAAPAPPAASWGDMLKQ